MHPLTDWVLSSYNRTMEIGILWPTLLDPWVEKEALAVAWACDRFSDYTLGCAFKIETDHKPLVPIINTKNLDNLPPRVVRFRLRLARFDYTIAQWHVPGKWLYAADALSRAPVNTEKSILYSSIKRLRAIHARSLMHCLLVPRGLRSTNSLKIKTLCVLK